MTQKAHINFGEAAGTYEGAGGLQRLVAENLAAMLPPLDLAPRPNVLEIGCGTGFLTRAMQAKYGPAPRYVLTDMALPMLEACREATPEAHYLCMDGQRPGVGPVFNLIASSMTVQWFDDPVETLDRLRGLLIEGGSLYYAMPGPDNFREWRAVLRRHGIDSAMRDDLPQTVPGEVERQSVTIDYGDARGFIGMLGQTGAATPKTGYVRPNPKSFKAACDDFDGKITWDIRYGCLTPLKR